MTTWFADTHYFIALLRRKDADHQKADRITAALRATRLITSTWVLTEVGNAFSAPNEREKFLRLLTKLRTDQHVEIVPADDELWQSGIDLYSRRLDKDWSLTDCISFVVMEQRQIREALTGDQHFVQAGYVALLA